MFPDLLPNQDIGQLWFSGGSTGARAEVDATGNGSFAPNTLFVLARASHDGVTYEVPLPNPVPVPFHVDWASGIFTIPNISLSADGGDGGALTLQGVFGPAVSEFLDAIPTTAERQAEDFDLDGVPDSVDPCPFFVLWAQDSLVLRDRAEVLTPGAMSVVSGIGPTEVFHDILVHQVMTGGAAILHDRAAVDHVIAAGPINEGNDLVVSEGFFGEDFAFVLPIPPTVDDFMVSGPTTTSFADTTLPLGSYTSVTISPNVTVTLLAGVYEIGTLVVHPDAELVVTGSTVLRIRDSLTLTGVVRHSNPNDLGLAIEYGGDAPVHIVRSFTGSVLAPNAKLVLGQNETTYQGTFQARSIEVLSDADILCDTFGDASRPETGEPVPAPSPESPPEGDLAATLDIFATGDTATVET